MSEPIKAKIARILNSREVVINAGSEQGIRKGMYFDILDPNGEDITDPDTGELLGSVDRPKVRVRVIQVKDRLSVASTFMKRQVNVGGIHLGGMVSRSLLPPKWVTEYQTLRTDEKTWDDLDESESFVKVGDPVVQVFGNFEDDVEVE